MSKLDGRLAELALIASQGPVEITYADTGFVKPNRWISNVIIKDFTDRGLIERDGNEAKVTVKGIKLLDKKEH